jgi:transcriptional regulator with XRE-family HTH domain
MEGHLQRIVGSNLRLVRQRLGLSQEAMADLLGVHRTYLGSVERGERNLTLRTVEGLADAIGIAPIELLTDGMD